MAKIHDLIEAVGREEADLFAFENASVPVASEIMSLEKADPAFSYTGWAFVSLPHKDPGQDENGQYRIWKKDGKSVSLTVRPGMLPDPKNRKKLVEQGVPFGVYARLIMIYIQTEAIKTGRREVFFGNSFNDFLGRLGIPAGGTTRKIVWEQLLRLSACEILFTWQKDENGPSNFHKANIVESGQLDFIFAEKGQESLWQDQIILSEAFCKIIQQSSIPLLENAVKLIASNSLALDIYIWLAFRLRALNRSIEISWTALHSQFGAEYARVRDFKKRFIPRLEQALAVYPEAKVDIEDDGLILHQSKPPLILK
jgi:hypothetical protein